MKKEILILIIFVIIILSGFVWLLKMNGVLQATTNELLKTKSTLQNINNDIFRIDDKLQKDTAFLSQQLSQIQQTLSNMNFRIVMGKVRKDGTIERGMGFSVTKKGVGNYSIIFDTPFAGKPTLVASIDDAEQPAAFIRVIHFSLNNRIDVSTLSDFDPKYGGGTCGDRGFSFVAIGPR